MYSMCLFMTPSAFFPLTLIFFYEKGFVSPCVKHIKSFDFESLKAALQLQLLFFFIFLKWWAELKKKPSKNNFYTTNIWSTRRSCKSNHKPLQTAVFSA